MVNWKYYFTLDTWTIHQASCLLYGIDPNDLKDQSYQISRFILAPLSSRLCIDMDINRAHKLVTNIDKTHNNLRSFFKSDSISPKDLIEWAKLGRHKINKDLISYINNSPTLSKKCKYKTAHSSNKKAKPDTRTNQLHVLLWRVYNYLTKQSNKRVTAQIVWNEIKNRHESHDTENIIQEVTPEDIFWKSAYNKDQKLKRTSFDKTLSLIKKNPP